MKKILFIAQMRNYGGVERSLINLLWDIPTDKYSVTVAVLGEHSDIIKEIPSWVEIKKIDGYTQKEFLISRFKKLKLIKAVRSAKYFLLTKRTNKISFKGYEISANRYPAIKEDYDAVIAWAMPDAYENIYALRNVSAKKKTIWMHMDLENYEMPQDGEKYLAEYDNIVWVSKACKNSFDKIYPSLEGKSKVFYNVIDKEGLLKASEGEKDISYDSGFSILTCGRLAKEKRIVYSVEVCKSLLKEGFTDFKWYFVGDGPYKKQLMDAICENHLEENIILLGAKLNPFPFVKDADLYVQMSSHESFCLTLAEAQMLGVPAVSTNFQASYEIVEENETGYLVEHNPQAIFESVKRIMEDKNEFKRLKNNTQKIDFKKFSGSFSGLEEVIF